MSENTGGGSPRPPAPAVKYTITGGGRETPEADGSVTYQLSTEEGPRIFVVRTAEGTALSGVMGADGVWINTRRDDQVSRGLLALVEGLWDTGLLADIGDGLAPLTPAEEDDLLRHDPGVPL